ncbi:MAG: hypothetical protein ACK559_11070, partial [bacterium]
GEGAGEVEQPEGLAQRVGGGADLLALGPRGGDGGGLVVELLDEGAEVGLEGRGRGLEVGPGGVVEVGGEAVGEGRVLGGLGAAAGVDHEGHALGEEPLEQRGGPGQLEVGRPAEGPAEGAHAAVEVAFAGEHGLHLRLTVGRRGHPPAAAGAAGRLRVALDRGGAGGDGLGGGPRGSAQPAGRGGPALGGGAAAA